MLFDLRAVSCDFVDRFAVPFIKSHLGLALELQLITLLRPDAAPNLVRLLLGYSKTCGPVKMCCRQQLTYGQEDGIEVTGSRQNSTAACTNRLLI